ncbi:MAG: ribosomal-processing cysteine protease Prp [Oscillospiraceae bacterium]|nr:ribosomal-processing cysteine protease Prp [Oscillospiraceae bacterium]
MITVRFFVSGGQVTGFALSGHANSASYGKDAVCSAVSSAAYMTANTLTEVCGLPVRSEVRDGYMKLVLTPKKADRAKELLDGFSLHIRALAKQYPKNLRVIYGGIKNA